MITDADIAFHSPDSPGYDWAETGFFNFYVPEINVLGIIYIVHRAGVGATVSDVEIIDKVSPSNLGSLYVNLCNHNRLPERAERFTLESGLMFEATSIRDYRIRFESADIGFDLQFAGIMEPYDIHDISMDPLASPEIADAIANSGFGAAYTAHFDMTVAVRGQLRLGDALHQVDCISTMDHSWGPRPETGFHPIVWSNAHFGRDLCLHGIFAFHPDAEPEQQHVFKHGYALIDGKVRGATDGSMIVEQDGPYIRKLRWTLTDVDGTRHHAEGDMCSFHPWQPYGNNYSPLEMIRWQGASGSEGHGTYMQGIPLNRLRRV